jgi:hypothetical protein
VLRCRKRDRRWTRIRAGSSDVHAGVDLARVSAFVTPAAFRHLVWGPFVFLSRPRRDRSVPERGSRARPLVGDGPDPDDLSTAHCGRLVAVRGECLAVREEDSDFAPGRPVQAAGVRGVVGIEPDNYITDPATGGCSD